MVDVERSHKAMQVKPPKLSVILCTFNPKEVLLVKALSSLAQQSFPASNFELIVVDNNSNPPLSVALLEKWANRKVILTREPRQGLMYARARGIGMVKSDLVIFLDDDNELDQQYLAEAWRIAETNSHLGVFGGKARGVFDKKIGFIRKAYLPFLGVRDLGNEPLEGDGNGWHPWVPIGAGMVVRRNIADFYKDYVESEYVLELGRKGGLLLSGEDSLLSRISYYMDLKCSYQPTLSLSHHVNSKKLSILYLCRLMYGHGMSHVILDKICGNSFDQSTTKNKWIKIGRKALSRRRNANPNPTFGMVLWDIGYFKAISELAACRDLPSLEDLFKRREYFSSGRKGS